MATTPPPAPPLTPSPPPAPPLNSTPLSPPSPQIDLGRVMTGGFNALRASFLPFLGAAALFTGLPTFIQQSQMMGAVASGNMFFFLSPLFWGSLLASFVGIFLLQGFVTRASILTMTGRDPDPAGSMLAALRLLLPLIGLALLTAVCIFAGLLFFIVPGVMIYIAFIVAVPALVEEKGGVMASIQRSFDLTRGSRWMIFLLVILFWVVSVIVSTTFSATVAASGLPP